MPTVDRDGAVIDAHLSPREVFPRTQGIVEPRFRIVVDDVEVVAFFRP